MTRVALILVSAPRWALEDCVSMPLFQRTVLSAQKGGIEEFIILARDSQERLKATVSEDSRVRATFHWADGFIPPGILREDLGSALMIIKAETVFDPNLVERLMNLELQDEVACVAVRRGTKGGAGCSIQLKGDKILIAREELAEANGTTAGLLLVRPEVARDLLSGPKAPGDLCGLIGALLQRGKVKALDVTQDLCMEITSVEALKESSKRLYGLLGLSSDSPLAVYVNRRLSGLLTSLLVRMPVTPNQVTLLSLLIGLVACWFFWHGGYWYAVLGVLIFHASVIVDLSDGEVARLKFMQSSTGAWLDSICDSIIYSGVLLSIAVALYRHTPEPHTLAVGIAATLAAFINSNLDFYVHSVKKSDVIVAPSAATPLRMIANEDNFYLALLAFVLFNKHLWFLWAAAIGCSIYILILIGEIFKNKSSSGKAG